MQIFALLKWAEHERIIIESNAVLFFFLAVFAEIEAKEACDWLRAAGFPQYVQLFKGKYEAVNIILCDTATQPVEASPNDVSGSVLLCHLSSFVCQTAGSP